MWLRACSERWDILLYSAISSTPSSVYYEFLIACHIEITAVVFRPADGGSSNAMYNKQFGKWPRLQRLWINKRQFALSLPTHLYFAANDRWTVPTACSNRVQVDPLHLNKSTQIYYCYDLAFSPCIISSDFPFSSILTCIQTFTLAAGQLPTIGVTDIRYSCYM